jgi:anti-sigma factor ChrR (cupin superfamily)
VNHHDPESGGPEGLAALYAAGAMPSEERAQFEAHLEGCSACQEAVRELGQVVLAFAEAAPPVTPRPEVRERLLRQLGTGAAAASQPTPLKEQLTGAVTPGASQDLIFRREAPEEWKDGGVPGVRIRILFVDRERDQFTALVRMAAGASYPGHLHRGPEECLVLEGDLHVGDVVMRPGDYQRAAAGSRHGTQSTENGCLLFIISSLSDEFGE